MIFNQSAKLFVLLSTVAFVSSGPVAYAQEKSGTTFEQALTYVYQNNPKLIEEREQLKILDERVAQAISGYRPSVAVNAATGYQRESVDGQPWVAGDDTSATLTVTQPLVTIGTLEKRRAADARVRAEREHLIGTEQNIFLAAITAWLEVCEKERVYAISYRNYERMQQYHSAIDERFKIGDATSTDVAQAESRLSESQAHLAIADADRAGARAVYERDIGIAAPEVVNFPPLPHNVPLSREEIVELARHNPAITEATHAEVAANHDVDVASSSMWPTFFLRGSMSEERSPALGLDRQRDDSITVNLSMPLYQGGAEYARLREAKLEKAKSLQQSRNAWLDVQQKANQSWANYNAARLVIQASQKAAVAGSKMLSGIIEEQKAGTRTLTDTLDAEAEFYGILVKEAEAQKNLRLESYRLLATVGRLTASGLDLNVQTYDPKPHYAATTPKWFGTSAE